MLNIYIARHGQDKDNEKKILNGRRNMPLTEKGILQAKELTKKIKNKGISFDYIYSSPLQRAYKTAEIISSGTDGNKNIIIEDGLIEREFGVMTGKPTSSIIQECSPNVIQTENINYFLCPKGAETFDELLDRGKNILNIIGKKHKNGNILLVCHGDIGKMIYAAFYNLKRETVLKNFYFGNSDLLLLSDKSNKEEALVFDNLNFIYEK